MATQEHGSADANADKATRIAAVVNEVMQRLDSGESVDFAEIEHTHLDLLPELGERLRELQAIRSARERARDDPPPSESRDAWLEEDLEFLRRSLDKYEVLGRVRHGGQGVVYQARQKGANRLVAIKVLLDGPLATDRQRRRFEREIELISRLSHPYIVTLHDTGTIRGRHYFTMEYVDGLPIDDYAVFHDLTPRQIVRLFIKICQAVSYAHQNGVIHRDLSPANILVDERGEPHVFDFGLAKDVWDSGGAGGGSLTGQFIGTLPYMSPEQAGGLDGKVDVRSDIYTLGVVLYEVLTDRFPYDVRGEPQEVRAAILNSPPTPLRKAAKDGCNDWLQELNTINRDLEEILVKALAKEKEARYQSVAAFAEDLERCLAGEAIVARTDNRFYLLRKSVRRYRVALVVVAVFLLTVGISWLQVRAQRDTARQAAQEAFDLFEDAYDVEEIVRRLPGGVAVRDDLIQRLSDRLPALEALAGADEALDPIHTRLLEKQGDIAAQQGRRNEAAGYFKAFLDGSLRLAKDEPGNGAYHDSVVRAYRKCAGVSDEPVPLYERGIEYAEGILRENPRRDEARYNLAEIHLSFGKQLADSEAYHDALEQFDAALSLCSIDDPELSKRWAQVAAVAKDERGRVLLKLGHGEEGLAELAASLQIREHIAEANPTDTIARQNLMLAYSRAGTAQRDAGNIAIAEELFRKSISLGELLREMDPSAADCAFDLYSAYDRVVRLLLVSGDTSEAAQFCDSAFALAIELGRYSEQSERAHSTLAFAYILRGRVYLAKQAPKLAYDAFEQAAAIRASLLGSDPASPRRREDLAVAQACLGEVCQRLGRFREAAEHHGDALTIRAQLYDEQPAIVERALEVVKTQINVAVAHIASDSEVDDTVAARLLAEANQRLETLRESGKLVGLERKYDLRVAAIQANQAIIRERAHRYKETGNGAITSDNSD